jgi:hypothetical protein
LCKNRGDFGTDYIAWPILCRMCFAALVRNLCDCRWLSRLQNIRYRMHATQSAVATAPDSPSTVTCLTRLDARVSVDKGTVMYAKANAVTNFPATIKPADITNPFHITTQLHRTKLFYYIHVTQLIAKKFPDYFGALNFIILFTKVRLRITFWATYIWFTPLHTASLICTYIPFLKAIAKKRLLASSCPSVRSQGNLNSLWANFRETGNSILMLKICWTNFSSVKIGQIQQALYKMTCAYLFSWFFIMETLLSVSYKLRRKKQLTIWK